MEMCAPHCKEVVVGSQLGNLPRTKGPPYEVKGDLSRETCPRALLGLPQARPLEPGPSRVLSKQLTSLRGSTGLPAAVGNRESATRGWTAAGAAAGRRVLALLREAGRAWPKGSEG